MKTSVKAATCAAVLGLAGPATAAMSVETFLAKIAGLKAKGPLALFSGDIGLLKRESASAMAGMTAEKKARAAAGKPPLYCGADKARMSAGEMITGLQAIPPRDRHMSLQDGFTHVIARKFPCS